MTLQPVYSFSHPHTLSPAVVHQPGNASVMRCFLAAKKGSLHALSAMYTHIQTLGKQCVAMDNAQRKKMALAAACTCLALLVFICMSLQKNSDNSLKESHEEAFEKALDFLLSLIEEGRSALSALFLKLLNLLLEWAEFLITLCEHYAKKKTMIVNLQKSSVN